MTMNRSSRPPAVPTLPKGEQIASYPTYIDAQKAVDHLADQAFPVQTVTIVGTDLRMVERVTGRLTYSRVALAGLASGAWFGLFVGLLLSLFTSTEAATLPILPAVLIGAAFGILFSVISYAFTGGKRDFTSSSQIVAGSYALLCDSAEAHKARNLLAQMGGGRPAPATPPTPAPTQTTWPTSGTAAQPTEPTSAQPTEPTSAQPTEPTSGGATADPGTPGQLPPSEVPTPHGDPARGLADPDRQSQPNQRQP